MVTFHVKTPYKIIKDMTCGTFSKQIIEKVSMFYQKTWKPITFTLRDIHLITRDD